MARDITLDNFDLNDIYNRPEIITSLLYKKLMQQLDLTIDFIKDRKYFEANRSIQLCQDILVRLGFGIKYEAGILADQLENLYQYMNAQLFQANLKKDPSLIELVQNIVIQLDQAWTQAVQTTGQEEISNSHPIKQGSINPYQKQELQQDRYGTNIQKEADTKNLRFL